MLAIKDLFSLIHSLTKSEKRYFRLLTSFQQGDKLYLQLFNTLEKFKKFDFQLQEELNVLFPYTSIEPARKHLYRLLMKSLRQYDSEKQIDVRLFNLMQDSKILFTRGLIDASFEQLDKAKVLALQFERFLLFIQAARQELQHLIQLQFEGLSEQQLIEKQDKISELLEYESRAHRHAALYEILLLRYWNNGAVRSLIDSIRLNDLLLEEHYILNSSRLQSFETHQLHLHFQSVYFLMANDVENSLKTFYELDTLFKQNAHLWKDTPIYYFHLLHGILQTLRRMEHYEEMTYFLSQLTNIPNVSENLALVIKYQVLEHELYRAVNLKQTEQTLKLIKTTTNEITQEVTRLPLQIQAQLWLTTSRAWYSAGDYTNALQAINQILSLPTNSYNRLLYVCCRLMNLLIHAALDNKDYLFYELRSIERKLKANYSLYKTEKLVINLLKQWIKNMPLRSYLDDLNLLENDLYEQQLIKDLDLHKWVTSMIKKS